MAAHRRLSATIFTTLLAFTLLVVLSVALAMMLLFYASYEHRAQDTLAGLAQETAAILEPLDSSERIATLAEQFHSTVRYTLIDEDGSVLFDSTPTAILSSHANRPEVQAALLEGSSTVARYSQTLHHDTIYAAYRLSGGEVVRLAEIRSSLLAFAGSLVLPMALALLVMALPVVIISRLLAIRILRPLNTLDVTQPLAGNAYTEMLPLLARIDEQQHQLKEQNRELARAESMRRDFSANVSHEMKTPLQVIAGYAELMKNGVVPPEKCPEFAALIYDESQNMRALINDVLTLSRLDESVFQPAAAAPVDLLALARDTTAHLKPIAEQRAVRLTVGGTPVRVAGTPALLDEMVSNLISNAIRYNRDGGTVTVHVEKSPNNQAVLTVQDTGIGIPAGEKEKIFERFYRVDKSRSRETGGTGLGLAIVKHAALLHGGSVEVTSEVGRGSTFTVRLPAAN